MPRIYVASLSDYNNRDLHGRWFDPEDFDFDPDELAYAVEGMIKEGPAAKRGEVAEEWAIHDYEDFGPIKISEWESFGKISAVAKALHELGGEAEAFEAYIGHVVGGIDYFDDIEAAVSEFQDRYIGEMSLEDYAYQCVDELILPEIPSGMRDTVESYFDYEKYARDLELGGDVTEAEGFLFRGF